MISKASILSVIYFFWVCASAQAIHPYFIVFLVDAPHLDYSTSNSLLKTIAKHPSNGSKNGDVGHAWLYLEGNLHGQRVYLEGGHSGELGYIQAKYFDGIMNCIEYGYPNPTPWQKKHPQHEPNPIKYLWEKQKDGFFQKGNGGHTPTYAAMVKLNAEQFTDILDFIKSYPFQDYDLTGNQCSSLISQVALLAGIDLPTEITVYINPTLVVGGETFTLWEDPRYCLLTFASPDLLEFHLKQSVQIGKATYALQWYKKTRPVSLTNRLAKLWEDLILFPKRIVRLINFS